MDAMYLDPRAGLSSSSLALIGRGGFSSYVLAISTPPVAPEKKLVSAKVDYWHTRSFSSQRT